MSKRPRNRASLMRLLRLARPELWFLVGGLLSLAVGSAATLLYPQGIRFVIDSATGAPPEWLGGSDRDRVLEILALAMAAIALVSATAMGLRYYLFMVAGERVIARLRQSLYRSILDQEIAFFDRERTGDLMSRLASDTATLQGSVSANISIGLRNLIQLLGGVVLLFITSPRLTLLILAIVPAIAIGAVIYGRRIRRLSRQVQDAIASGQAVAEESIGGIRTVRAFAAETAEAGRYNSAIDRALSLAKQRIFASSAFMSALTFLAYASAAMVFWYGGKLVGRGEISAGELTSFLVYTLLVGFALGSLTDLWADFSRALGAADRVFEVLDRTPSLADGAQTISEPRGHIEFRDVGFCYPSRPDSAVLSNFDLSIETGQVVALVGPSGAGKSTVTALLLRLYDPDSGVICFDGRDLRDLEVNWIRRQIGFVAQEPQLFSTSIADNIRYGHPEATRGEIEDAARAANAHDFITEFSSGYDTMVGERGVQLSGGQKQRVAIARAVLKNPRILVLDEATSALDAHSEHLVVEALERLMKDRTTLVIAHRLSTVRGANEVVVLDHGTVQERGHHDELLSRNGPYRQLIERQFTNAGSTGSAG